MLRLFTNRSIRKMSMKHLTVGSVDPPRTNKDLLRVYSMAYCPFAHRAWLVLKAKKLPYEIVNVNLFKKPDWYFKLNPEGKVPTLLDGSKIITESLVIADYLEDKYPHNPLYPSDPEAKRKDKQLIESLDEIISVFTRCIYRADQKTTEEWLQDFLEVLVVLEEELKGRGSEYFGGERPGMVDYMLWPWAERAPVITTRLGGKLPLKETDVPLLRKWRKTMAKDPVVEELQRPPEEFWNIVDALLKKVPPMRQFSSFWTHHSGCRASAPMPIPTSLSLWASIRPSASSQPVLGSDQKTSPAAAALGQRRLSRAVESTCSAQRAASPPTICPNIQCAQDIPECVQKLVQAVAIDYHLSAIQEAQKSQSLNLVIESLYVSRSLFLLTICMTSWTIWTDDKLTLLMANVPVTMTIVSTTPRQMLMFNFVPKTEWKDSHTSLLVTKNLDRSRYFSFVAPSEIFPVTTSNLSFKQWAVRNVKKYTKHTYICTMKTTITNDRLDDHQDAEETARPVALRLVTKRSGTALHTLEALVETPPPLSSVEVLRAQNRQEPDSQHQVSLYDIHHPQQFGGHQEQVVVMGDGSGNAERG